MAKLGIEGMAWFDYSWPVPDLQGAGARPPRSERVVHYDDRCSGAAPGAV